MSKIITLVAGMLRGVWHYQQMYPVKMFMRWCPPARTSIMAVARSISLLLLSGVVLAALCDEGWSTTINQSTSDLWNGASVGSHNAVLGAISNINNMFGATGGSPEPGNTIFNDGNASPDVVEWTTPTAITLKSFALFAQEDGPPNYALGTRGISSFKLYAWNSGTSTFDLIFSYSPGNPYGSSSAPPDGFLSDSCTLDNYLCLGVNLAPVTTDTFRAEFVPVGTDLYPGPRIQELDGYGDYFTGVSHPSAVPLPATLPLFGTGLGLAGLFGWRRKRKNTARAAV
jgi:PEP-CTERM motif